MKLILVILKKDDEASTIEQLNKADYFVTKISTSGGFLKQKNSTLLIGTKGDEVDRALAIIKSCSGVRKSTLMNAPTLGVSVSGDGSSIGIPVDVEIGGSTVFVLNVDDFQKL